MSRTGRDRPRAAALPQHLIFASMLRPEVDFRIAGRSRIVHDSLRSGNTGSDPRRSRGAVMDGPRTSAAGIFKDFRKRCSAACASRRSTKTMAPYLQPFFMEPPPEIDTSTITTTGIETIQLFADSARRHARAEPPPDARSGTIPAVRWAAEHR